MSDTDRPRNAFATRAIHAGLAPDPSFGSVMSRLRGNGMVDIPPYVSLYGSTIGQDPGYLGVAHRAFSPGGQGLADLNLAGGVNRDRNSDRQGLLQRFDLSYLYPFQGLSVIFITILAAVVLKEKLSARLTIGALLITAGIVLVSMS